MAGWSILFWLIVTFLLLYPLNRWINSRVQGVAFLLTGSRVVAIWFFWVLFLPGTLLHELSHWLAAVILRVPARSFSLWPKTKRNGHLQMGAVQIDVSDPFRHSLIGLAPLICGSIAVLLIGQGWLGLGRLGEALTSGDLDDLTQTVENILAVPDVWLLLYLVFAISNAMLPSESDRESWRTVLIYLGLAFVLTIGLGFNPTLTPEIQEFGITILTYLLSAFVITISVDIVVIFLLMVTEVLLSRILRRRIWYNS